MTAVSVSVIVSRLEDSCVDPISQLGGILRYPVDIPSEFYIIFLRWLFIFLLYLVVVTFSFVNISQVIG